MRRTSREVNFRGIGPRHWARRQPLARWLIQNMPRGVELEVPDRRSSRTIPFSDDDE